MANRLTVSYNGNSNFYTEEKEGNFSIKYGSYISEELGAGQSRTLKCGNCVMDGNLIIGNRTFNCNKYKMATDVEISVISLFPSTPSGYNYYETYKSNTTFYAPKDGWYRIEVYGCSGNGGNLDTAESGGGIWIDGEEVFGTYYNCGGGGGGAGCAISEIKLKAGDSIRIEIGTVASGYNGGLGGTTSAIFTKSSIQSYPNLTVTGARNGYQGNGGTGGGGKGGAGGKGEGGNVLNYTGETGDKGDYEDVDYDEEVPAIVPAAGGDGYNGVNNGGNGYGFDSRGNSISPTAGSNGLVKIYSGNTN